ncbi:uncharacterized protein slc35g1 isoform X2 [Pristis pectinata]|uniref:uncharacterized protein slc35g1 isoform X2 n=1 Tax=Pristis pectinata TaxID=685728 RepID=UPI00223CACAD|nr:uncharacterized protein slc35g1 isoform X2 [Pristis pectinata]
MSAYYDPEQDFVVVALGAQPCVNEVLMEKPSGGAAANAECNGIPETGHRAAAREDFNFAACCHSQRVGHSADEETSSDPPGGNLRLKQGDVEYVHKYFCQLISTRSEHAARDTVWARFAQLLSLIPPLQSLV